MENSTIAPAPRSRVVLRTWVDRALPQWSDLPVRQRDLLRDLGILTRLFLGTALCLGAWRAIVIFWQCFREVRPNPRAAANNGRRGPFTLPAFNLGLR